MTSSCPPFCLLLVVIFSPCIQECHSWSSSTQQTLRQQAHVRSGGGNERTGKERTEAQQRQLQTVYQVPISSFEMTLVRLFPIGCTSDKAQTIRNRALDAIRTFDGSEECNLKATDSLLGEATCSTSDTAVVEFASGGYMEFPVESGSTEVGQAAVNGCVELALTSDEFLSSVQSTYAWVSDIVVEIAALPETVAPAAPSTDAPSPPTIQGTASPTAAPPSEEATKTPTAGGNGNTKPPSPTTKTAAPSVAPADSAPAPDAAQTDATASAEETSFLRRGEATIAAAAAIAACFVVLLLLVFVLLRFCCVARNRKQDEDIVSPFVDDQDMVKGATTQNREMPFVDEGDKEGEEVHAITFDTAVSDDEGSNFKSIRSVAWGTIPEADVTLDEEVREEKHPNAVDEDDAREEQAPKDAVEDNPADAAAAPTPVDDAAPTPVDAAADAPADAAADAPADTAVDRAVDEDKTRDEQPPTDTQGTPEENDSATSPVSALTPGSTSLAQGSFA